MTPATSRRLLDTQIPLKLAISQISARIKVIKVELVSALVFRGVTEMCACPSNEVRDVENRAEGVQTHINQLPVEILREILSYLPLHRLFVVQRVCRRWRDTVVLLMSTVQQFVVRIFCPFKFPEVCRGSRIYYNLVDTGLGIVLNKMSTLKSLQITALFEGCSDRMDVSESPTSMVVNIHPKCVELYGARGNKFQTYLRKRLNLEVVNLPSSRNAGMIMRFNRHTAKGYRNTRCRLLWNMLPNTLERLGMLANCMKSEDVARLGEFCPNLVDIDVTGIYHVYLNDFRSMLVGLPRLRTLSTIGESLEYDTSLDNIGDQLTELAVYDLTDFILQRIVKKLPHLTSLTLGNYDMTERYGLDALTQIGIAQIVQLEQLSKLTFDDLCLAHTVWDALIVLPLFELHFHREFPASGYDVANFIMCSLQLEVLGLHDVIAATANMLEHMADLISPSCWIEIRDNKSGRLLAILPETRSNTARRILVTVDEDWYYKR